MTREEVLEQLKDLTSDGWAPRQYEQAMEYAILYIEHLSKALRRIDGLTHEPEIKGIIEAALDIDA